MGAGVWELRQPKMQLLIAVLKKNYEGIGKLENFGGAKISRHSLKDYGKDLGESPSQLIYQFALLFQPRKQSLF